MLRLLATHPPGVCGESRVPADWAGSRVGGADARSQEAPVQVLAAHDGAWRRKNASGRSIKCHLDPDPFGASAARISTISWTPSSTRFRAHG
jgi:hypothetical protein